MNLYIRGPGPSSSTKVRVLVGAFLGYGSEVGSKESLAVPVTVEEAKAK